MTRFETSIVIRQPIEKVFAFATNLDNNAQWQSEIIEFRQTSQGPFGQGARYRCVNKFLGRRIETEGHVTTYEPNRRCVYKITSGTITGETSFSFEAVAEGTMFTTVGSVDFGSFKLLKSFVIRKAQQQMIDDLKRLKLVLENDFST